MNAPSSHPQTAHPVGIPAPQKRFVTPSELAKELGVSKSTIARWRAEGAGPPPTQIGPRSIVYAREGIERWIAARTTGSASNG
jgi:prophage regulatory protein